MNPTPPRPTRIAVLLALPVFAVSACSSSSESEYTAFTEALKDGASCQELFDTRNEWAPDASYIEDANAALREIGCFSSSSTRSDS